LLKSAIEVPPPINKPANFDGVVNVRTTMSEDLMPTTFPIFVGDNFNTTLTDNSTRLPERDDIPNEVDHFFLLIMSIIIFFMQCGFAFMEAGAVR